MICSMHFHSLKDKNQGKSLSLHLLLTQEMQHPEQPSVSPTLIYTAHCATLPASSFQIHTIIHQIFFWSTWLTVDNETEVLAQSLGTLSYFTLVGSILERFSTALQVHEKINKRCGLVERLIPPEGQISILNAKNTLDCSILSYGKNNKGWQQDI